jgi:hypothetical protein
MAAQRNTGVFKTKAEIERVSSTASVCVRMCVQRGRWDQTFTKVCKQLHLHSSFISHVNTGMYVVFFSA